MSDIVNNAEMSMSPDICLRNRFHILQIISKSRAAESYDSSIFIFNFILLWTFYDFNYFFKDLIVFV